MDDFVLIFVSLAEIRVAEKEIAALLRQGWCVLAMTAIPQPVGNQTDVLIALGHNPPPAQLFSKLDAETIARLRGDVWEETGAL